MTVIKAYGHQLNIACDGQCNKAFGLNNRSRNQLSEDEDDFEWLSDGELGAAPIDTSVYEGDEAKPTDNIHNKWCLRECERSVIDQFPNMPTLKDFSQRVKN